VGVRALLIAGACAAARPAAAQRRAVQPAPESWLVAIEAEGAYESNVRFQSPNDPGDQIGRLNGSALRSWQGPRGQISFAGRGSAAMYRDSRDLNRFTYDLVADGARRVTPRLTMSGAALYETRLSSELNAAVSDLPILPLSLSRTIGGSTLAEYRLSPLMSTTGRVEYTRVTFDSPLLFDGDALDARATLARRYAREASVSLVGEAQQGSTQGQPLATQTAAAAWDATRGNLGARLQAGVTRSSAGPTPHYGPSGAAELRLRVHTTGQAMARYTRTVAQAFGLGTLLTTDQVAAGYDRASLRGTLVHLGVSRGWSSDPTRIGGQLVTSDATVDLRKVFLSGVTVGGGAFVRRRVDVQQVTGTGVRLVFGYTLRAR